MAERLPWLDTAGNSTVDRSWQTEPARLRSFVHVGEYSAFVAEGEMLKILWERGPAEMIRSSEVVDVPLAWPHRHQ